MFYKLITPTNMKTYIFIWKTYFFYILTNFIICFFIKTIN